MIYEYRCDSCGRVFEKDCPSFKPADSPRCECGQKANRHFAGFSFVLKGGGWPSKSQRFNAEMTERNERAGRRMRKEHGDPPKLVDQR